LDVSNILSIVIKYAVPAVLALLVLWIGRLIARKASKGTEHALNRSPKADASLSVFFAGLVGYLILIAAVIAALTVLGVDTQLRQWK